MARNHDTSFFAQNLSIPQVILYFMAAMGIGIIGGLTNQLWLMLLTFIPAVAAIMGWCPMKAVYQFSRRSAKQVGRERKLPKEDRDGLSHQVA